jgi:hypothetical protein
VAPTLVAKPFAVTKKLPRLGWGQPGRSRDLGVDALQGLLRAVKNYA